MAEIARVVTSQTRDDFVDLDANNNPVGICVKLWHQVAKDLQLKTQFQVVRWGEMYDKLRDKESDVIMQRVDEGQMQREGFHDDE